MKCSVCNQQGHNKRTCPNTAMREQSSSNQTENRDRSLIIRIDNLTEDEQTQLHTALRDAKRAIAPDGRATLVEGKTSELPSKIQELMSSNANQTLLPSSTE